MARINKMELTKLKKIIFGSIAFVFTVVIICMTFYTIDSTKIGVKRTFGKISNEIVTDGFHVKFPFVQTITKVNVQQKKFDCIENSYTKDVQTSEVDYTINYDLVKSNVSLLMKNIGKNYHERIVIPFIRSALKDVFGNYTAVEIVENRELVRKDVENILRKTLDSTYFYNIQFQITDIDFDDAFEKAIAEKQVAEQNALKAKNVTIQVEEQAKQTKIKAEAEAAAMQIKATALERNQKLVEYEAVQKWNGKLPDYMMGNTVPFINLR